MRGPGVEIEPLRGHVAVLVDAGGDGGQPHQVDAEARYPQAGY